MATTVPVTMDTLVTIKVSIQGTNRKFKVPMRDLGAAVLPTKVSPLLFGRATKALHALRTSRILFN